MRPIQKFFEFSIFTCHYIVSLEHKKQKGRKKNIFEKIYLIYVMK